MSTRIASTATGSRRTAITNRDRFQLSVLDVSMNYLSKRSVARLQRVAPRVLGYNQKDGAETGGARVVSYGG